MSIFREKIFTPIINIVIYTRFHRLRREFNRKLYSRVYHVRIFGNKMSRINISRFYTLADNYVVKILPTAKQYSTERSDAQ